MFLLHCSCVVVWCSSEAPPKVEVAQVSCRLPPLNTLQPGAKLQEKWRNRLIPTEELPGGSEVESPPDRLLLLAGSTTCWLGQLAAFRYFVVGANNRWLIESSFQTGATSHRQVVEKR